MSLKAVLFDFNGVIINDESIHEQLIEELLVAENLRVKPEKIREVCLGRSDRACLQDLLSLYGRVVTSEEVENLIARKAQAYQQQLNAMSDLPLYDGLRELITRIQAANLKIALVTGAIRDEVELVLTRAGLIDYFSVIVAGDDITTSKPEPDGYLLALQRLNLADETLNLQPEECLAIEDTFAGIEAAKRAGIPVVGVAHTYPFHMLQRRADWCVDYLQDLELERILGISGEVALSEPG
ncbi:MAG: HAD family phosphatase [Arthrospira sp. SH-MAG29]|nr:HAD family phosphatase [Arthrospira sp. SH-MAG29]MBS0016536.1 HAD family phosphatase [Arthrospira sp. SH-MAG29]